MSILQNNKNSTKRLKYVATLNDDVLSETTDASYELDYLDIGNVDSSGTIQPPARYFFENAPSRARRRLRDGDVIISTVRTYLQAIATIRNPPDNLIVSTGFAVVRPKADVFAPGFCSYALREPSFLAEVVARSTGISYPAINASDLAAIPVPVPPLSEQSAIAEFLDRETAKIDQMLAAKEKLLKILDEKRRAIITHAITKGVNPSAKLKSSGIPWLGSIPAHWEIVRAKWLFKERDERSTVGDEVLLSLRMEKGLVPHNDVSDKQTNPEELIGYKKTSVGEIVINRMRAASGLIAITPMEGLVSPDYAVFQVSAEVDAIFYKHLFTTELLQGVFRSESTGLGTGSSGFLRLYSDSFLSLWFPFPPLDEQRTIVEHIKKETARIDAMSLATQRSIELLKERRSALITEVVTGRNVVEEANG